MIWQDLVIAIACIVFLISLIIQVYYGYKKRKALIALATSIPTSIALYSICVAYFTLDLYFSFIVTTGTAIVWTIIVIQGIIYSKVA